MSSDSPDLDPKAAARHLGHQCRMPADRWDGEDREQAAQYLGVLADADLYPDHAAGLRDRLGEWSEGDRDNLVDDLREYAIEASESLKARADEQAGGWRAEYETTTYRGPDRYPVPEDWTLGIVEGDGITWKRPERPEDAERGWSPEDRASTLNEFDYDSDERTVTFDVNGDPVFTVTDPDRDDLMASIAGVLRQVARGESYHGVDAPEDYGAGDEDESEDEDASDVNASLGNFGGGA